MTVSFDSLFEQKKTLRRTMRGLCAATAENNPGAPESLRDTFLRHAALPPESVVAATIALPGEMNPAPLCAALRARGHVLCLPCIADGAERLVFRIWKAGAVLVPGAFGVFEPPASAPETGPDVLLVPLLAFDRALNRLGQGGGYYDRTLKTLRRQKNVTAFGLAFSVQEVPSIPVGPDDEPLDAVITEADALCRAFMNPDFA